MNEISIIIDDSPRNYLVVSSDSDFRHRFVIERISTFLNCPIDKVYDNPDVKYVSLPVIDSSNKVISSLSNKELILRNYGLLDKVGTNKIGSEITINQIRDVISFSQISAHQNMKFVIINNAKNMNNEASSALLKTLEEVSSKCSFILLCDSYNDVPETVRSRCQFLAIEAKYSIKEALDFKDIFFTKHSFLKDLSEDYELDKLLDNVISEIQGLLEKKYDPLDISNNWSSSYVNLILEIVSEYIFFICRKSLLGNQDNLSVSDLKKLSQIHLKLPSIKRNLLHNINVKYLLNNLTIELAA